MNVHLDAETVVTIIAILVGPIMAAVVGIWLQDRKERISRKNYIFKTLLSTRAMFLLQDHVRALNMIDVEFTGNNSLDKDVRDKWKALLNHFGKKPNNDPQWGEERARRLTDLLFSMSKNLKYDIEKSHIESGAYAPVFYENIETQIATIREKLIELLDKGHPFPIRIIEEDESSQ
ncbi:DUF6680 family protein [Desulfovibrio sp. X2]|uniref:DUF6680 family protein n=1 Tax=Desulfovibrio sp. X2 TaxID=941449 RepID=UPI0012689929|nr:DUF6680 family protein [Desulfovibrio sp. X2]